VNPRRQPDLETMSREAAALVGDAAARAVSERGRFTLALSGGTAPRRLYELLAMSALPWDKTHLFWGDERFVPKTDARSNFRLVKETLLSKAAVPAANVHPVPVELGTPAAAADAYERELRAFFRGDGTFDLNLLGMGPDGHTASLFPGEPSLGEVRRWAIAVDGKKGDPPVPRVTLTFPAINASRAALFLVASKEKLPLVEEIMKGGAPYPAARVAPRETLTWLVVG
jgi:6-phosphogluconolactonase